MAQAGQAVSTDDFPKAQRAELWRKLVADKMFKVEWEIPAGAAPKAKLIPVLCAGEIEIACLETGPFSITNTPAHARRKAHRCSLQILIGGARATTERAGGAIALGKSMGVLLDESRFYRQSSDNPATQALILMLPKARLVERVASFSRLIGEPFDQKCKPFRVLQSYLNLFAAGVDLNAPEMARLNGEYVMDLVAMMLQERADHEAEAVKRTGQAARYRIILSEIERGLADPKLSGRMVAGCIGITERYLQQLMEANGATFSHYLLRARLDKAAALLAEKREMRVAEVAFLSGFGDLSYFNRSFKKRFGESPRGYRK